MNIDEELKNIWEDPTFADIKPKPVSLTSNDRLVQSFQEVNQFYETHRRLPQQSGDIMEKGLARRFEAILCDRSKLERCLPHDRFGLIREKEMDIDAELKELFNDPIFNISKESQALFDVPTHLRKEVDKSTPDFVAQRQRCPNFELFEAGFKRVHAELNSGKRNLIRFHESHFQEGSYFLLGGVLVLLDKIIEPKKDKKHRFDGRTHCVFENGTESNLFLQSLRKAIYSDGYTVQENQETNDELLKERFSTSINDRATGYIYVLRSKSKNPAIAQYTNLYKIGFTTKTVEERIANAANETTYLMDDVEVVATWEIQNLSTSYFENMLHQLFQDVRLSIKIYHESGITIVPKEWFIVSLPIIKQAIEFIVNGIPISYNAKDQMIVRHNSE